MEARKKKRGSQSSSPFQGGKEIERAKGRKRKRVHDREKKVRKLCMDEEDEGDGRSGRAQRTQGDSMVVWDLAVEHCLGYVIIPRRNTLYVNWVAKSVCECDLSKSIWFVT